MEIKPNIDWTHKELSIEDIRKLNKLYVIKVQGPQKSVRDIIDNDFYNAVTQTVLFVKDMIFETRLESYFLKPITQISREEILSVKWNMYLTKGYYVKIDEEGNIEKFPNTPDRWYVSYLEIAGPLGSFCSVYSNNKESYNTHKQ